jgi:hypothetical protein
MQKKIYLSKEKDSNRTVIRGKKYQLYKHLHEEHFLSSIQLVYMNMIDHKISVPNLGL